MIFNTLNNLTLLDSEAIIKKMKEGVKLKIVLISCVSILSAILIYFLCIGIHSTLSTQAATYYVSSLSDLENIANNIKNGNSYKGHVIKLTCDIDGGGADFIGFGTYYHTDMSGLNEKTSFCFSGIFDGDGYSIGNLKLTHNGTKQTRSIIGQKQYLLKYRYYASMFAYTSSDAIIKNVRFYNIGSNVTLPADKTSGGGHHTQHTLSTPIVRADALVKNCLSDRDIGDANLQDCLIKTSNSCMVIDASGKSYTDVGNSAYSSLSNTYWFVPKTTEYNAGYPMLRSFIEGWDTYTVQTVNNTDVHAVDKGTVNISEFKVPLPKDNSSTKYIGIPNNNQTGYTFTVAVTDQIVVATPACETCRQFSHWEVNGKTLIAHFKAKEVPANCTVKFNGHSFANTTSSIGLFEFKLHPGSTIKCEVSDDKQIYTYIVVKGGDCPDCGRPLTTGEEYARITYTIKIDAGQPASKYELDSLDSGGFIKGSYTEYTITESTTISPTFKLKEYDVEVS